MVDTDGLSGGATEPMADVSTDAPMGDASADVLVDADVCDGSVVHVVKAFDEDLKPFVVRMSSSATTPSVQTIADGKGVLLLQDPDGGRAGLIADLFYPTSIPFRSVTGSFDLYAGCDPSGDDCSDGVAMFWGDRNEVPQDTESIRGGGGVGVPSQMNGGAVLFDLFRNDGDPMPPAIELLKPDSTKDRDLFYAWQVSSVHLASADRWLTVKIAVHDGDVSLDLGDQTISGKVAPVDGGIFGFGSAKGNHSKPTFGVRRVDLTFSSCP